MFLRKLLIASGLLFLSAALHADMGGGLVSGSNQRNTTPAFIGQGFPVTGSFTVGTSSDVIFMPTTLYGPAVLTTFRASLGTQSNSDLMDFGIYNSTGMLIVHTGLVDASAALGVFNSTVTATSLSPGIYYMAVQITGTNAQLGGILATGSNTNPQCFKVAETTAGLPGQLRFPGSATIRCFGLWGVVQGGAI